MHYFCDRKRASLLQKRFFEMLVDNTNDDIFYKNTNIFDWIAE